MKCPVCGTKLDNTHICPNCGMVLKKEDIKQTSIKKPEYLGKELSTSKKVIRILRLFIIITVLLGLVMIVLVPFFKEASDGYSYQKIANMTFQEVIDEGYDTKDTIKNLITYRDDFIDNLNKEGYEVRFVNDTCYQEKSTKPLIASSDLTVVIEDGHYYAGVCFTFKDGNLYSTKLYYSSSNIKNKEFNIEKMSVDIVSCKLNMEDAYFQLKNAFNHIEEVEEGKYIFDKEIDGYHVDIEVKSQYISNIFYGYDSIYSIEKVWVD